jgi:ubiquinone biosynthesis protein
MLRRRLPEWLAAAPDMPQLVHDYLTLATRGRLELRIASDDLKAIERRVRRGQNLAVWLAVAFALVISGVLAGLMALSEPHAPYLGWAAIVTIGAGLAALLAARRLS